MRYPKLQPTKTTIAGLVLVLSLCAQALVPFLAQNASAGTLSNTLVRFDRLAASTATTGLVCAKEASTGTDAVASVTFPTGFTVSTTTPNTTWAVSTSITTDWPTGAQAWPGIAAPTGAGNFTVSGQTVNFQSGDLTAGTLYCFNWTNSAALTTGSAGSYTGSVTTKTSAPATIDSGNYATTIVGANADQVTVSATVQPTFSMSVSPNSDSLGNLSSSSVSTGSTPPVATVSTNSANGWYLWGKDSSAGLHSNTNTHTIASNCSSNHGTNTTLGTNAEGYNLGAVATSGTETIAAVFAGGPTGKGGGLCSTNYQTIASDTTTANNAQVTMTNYAAISNTTPPATDYSDTETFVGAGLF